jgi:putative FmdB family regulatory protein
MPKYLYRCDGCDKEWSEWASISAPTPDICPHCLEDIPYKIPPSFLTYKKNDLKNDKEVGEVVEDAIVRAKQDLKKHIEDYKEKDDDRF